MTVHKSRNIKPLIPPVYNVGDYGQDVRIPITSATNGTDTVSVQSIVLDVSTTTIQQILDTTSTPIDDNELAISDANIVGLMNLGDNTAWSKTFSWTPDMNAEVYKVSLAFAAALNVSAWTSGNFNLNLVRVRAVERDTGRLIIPLLTFNQPNITANLVAVGCQILIIMADYDTTFKVKARSAIDITISITSSVGVGTRQEGLLTVFAWNKPQVLKPFSLPIIKLHVHATLDHAAEVFKEDIELLGEWD